MKGFLLVVLIVMLAYPVTAAINTISTGGTVFIGEDNLDISAALGSNDKIAYFTGSGGEPERIISVGSSKTSFYFDPSDFSDRTGAWYAWSNTATKATAPLAFYVDDPYLKVKVRDTDLDIDVTNKWLPRGDNLGFSIETNLASMTERGIAGAPVTIKVRSPSGTTYSTLANAAGTDQSLNVEVPSSPCDPGISWFSGDLRYSSGTYTIYLESEANDMKDNYPVDGKTTSAKVTVLLQTKNPLISSGTTATTVPTMVLVPTTTVQTTAPTMATTATAVPSTTTAATTLQTTATAPVTTIATVRPTTIAPGFDGIFAVVGVFMAVSLLLISRH